MLLAAFIVCCMQQAYAQTLPLCNVNTCYTADSCNATVNTQTYTYATVHNVYKSSTANVNLAIDIYSPCNLPVPIGSTPNPNTCTGCRRPFILLVHGGGFRGGCRNNMAPECIEFAKRGYIAATIDYRLGWVNGDEDLQNCNTGFCFNTGSCANNIDNNNCRPIYTDSNKFAVYRSLQDVHAAMRFIAHYASQLNIDTRYLYIGGQSAGSVAAVNIAYVNAAELSTALPGAASVLGKLDTAGNTFTDAFKIAGVYNNWGAVLDTSLITGTANRIPMIAFHGSDDGVVPYAHANFLSCPYYDSSYGSKLIYKRLTHQYPGLPVQLFSCVGGHGIFKDGDKAKYRILKAICFFRNAKLGNTDTVLVQRPEFEDDIPLDSLEKWFPLQCGSGSKARYVQQQVLEDEATLSVQGNSIYSVYTVQQQSRIEIVITDIMGRRISQDVFSKPAGSYSYLSAPVETPGIYIATVLINGRRVAVQKVPVNN